MKLRDGWAIDGRSAGAWKVPKGKLNIVILVFVER